jgi:hypothetical protein
MKLNRHRAAAYSRSGDWQLGPTPLALLVDGSATYGSVVNLSVAALTVCAACGIAAARTADGLARAEAPALAV